MKSICNKKLNKSNIEMSYPHEQSTSACCDSLTRFPPFFKKYAPSIAPTVPNDQHDPQTD